MTEVAILADPHHRLARIIDERGLGFVAAATKLPVETVAKIRDGKPALLADVKSVIVWMNESVEIVVK